MFVFCSYILRVCGLRADDPHPAPMCPTPTLLLPPTLLAPVSPGLGSASPGVASLRVLRTLALVDLDAFYVSVERRRDPTLVGRPVVVGGAPHERGVVSCASYEARGHGVHAAMPLAEAAALLPARCPACVRRQAQHPTSSGPATSSDSGGWRPNLNSGDRAGALRSAGWGAEGRRGGRRVVFLHKDDAGARAASRACRGSPATAAVQRSDCGCPVFLHGDHAAYAQASRQVMEVLESFTPALETVSLDEAYLDLTGCERHHRSWTAAAQSLREAVLAATGLSVSVGIGGTRAVAKVAAALAKPAGIVVVRPGEERAFLAALPLEHLPGIGEKTRAQLERFNLRSIGDLAAMPDGLLEATFGRMGPALARRARGQEDDGGARVGTRTPKTRSISRDTTFAADTDDPQVVDGTLSHLAQRAARALRAAGLCARAVGVRLRYSDFDTVETRQRLPAPTDLDHEILERVRALWPARWTRRVRLRLVGVVLHDLVEAGERQLNLGLCMPDAPRQARREPPDAPLPTALGETLAAYAPRSHLGPEEARVLDCAVDRAVDAIRDRHGFGALVRGRAIALLGFARAPRQARRELPTHAAAR